MRCRQTSSCSSLSSSTGRNLRPWRWRVEHLGEAAFRTVKTLLSSRSRDTERDGDVGGAELFPCRQRQYLTIGCLQPIQGVDDLCFRSGNAPFRSTERTIGGAGIPSDRLLQPKHPATGYTHQPARSSHHI